MLKMNCSKTTLLASAFLLSSALVPAAFAAENGALNYPAGSPGATLGEFPPIPGLFMVSQTSYTTSDGLYDADGDKIAEEEFEMDALVETIRFLVSYPGDFMGAHMYSQLVVPIVNIENSLSINTPFGSMDIFDDSDTGLGNLTVSPIVLHWAQREKHQYFTAGIDVALEAGASYDENNYVNAATGYNSIIPVVAYRYDKPDGFDFAIKADLMFNLENSNTDYDTGDMLAFDFYTGWNFGKWKVGVVGGYTYQFEKDTQNGVDVEDSELLTLNMGPSVMYSAGPLVVNVNCQFGVIAQNTAKSDSFWVNVALPLFVPQPPMPK